MKKLSITIMSMLFLLVQTGYAQHLSERHISPNRHESLFNTVDYLTNR